MNRFARGRLGSLAVVGFCDKPDGDEGSGGDDDDEVVTLVGLDGAT